MLPVHLDTSLPLLEVPDDVIARLKRNGNAHKYRARKINIGIKAINDNILDPNQHLPLIEIHDVDIIACYFREDWTCPECFKRVDITKAGRHPQSPVCGHRNNFANGGGHVAENIFPYHFSCNALVASGIEVPRGAKVNRLRKKHLGIDKDGEAYEKPKSKFKNNGGFSKQNGSFKLKSRNSFKKGKSNVRYDDA